MPTHTDNRHFGMVFNEPTFEGNLNMVDGIDLGTILDYVPKPHDISDQCNGTQKTFNLDPPVSVYALHHVTVVLNGVTLAQGQNTGDDDWSITTNGGKITIGNTTAAPAPGSSLVVYYVPFLPAMP